MRSVKSALGLGARNTGVTGTNTSTVVEATPIPPDPAIVGVREGTTVKETVATAAFPTTSYVSATVPVTTTVPIVSETLQVQKSIAPVIMEKREIAPVVHERVRREEIEEIHPVIHREREKTEIHKITQPIHTSAVMGVIAQEGTLAAQIRPEIRTPGMIPPALILPRREELQAQKVRVERPPIILETEKKRIIEEVTPLVYREVVEPHLTKFTQPIYEKIVEGDVYVTQVLPARVEGVTYQQTLIPVTTAVAAPVATNVEVANTFVAEKQRLAQPTAFMTGQPHTNYIRENAIMQPTLTPTAYATGVSTPPIASTTYASTTTTSVSQPLGFAQPFGTTGLGPQYGGPLGFRGAENTAQGGLNTSAMGGTSLASQQNLGQYGSSALNTGLNSGLNTGSFMNAPSTTSAPISSSV
jgi:hypothetical protein